MRDDLDGLREIDEDRALAPPQDVERGEVTVDAVDRDKQRELVEQLVPHAQRDRRREVDLRETRRRALGVADEGHEITVVQALHPRARAGRALPCPPPARSSAREPPRDRTACSSSSLDPRGTCPRPTRPDT